MVTFGNFCDVIPPIFEEFFTIARKIKNGKFIFIRFSTLRIIHKTGSKLREGGSAYPSLGQGLKDIQAILIPEFPII